MSPEESTDYGEVPQKHFVQPMAAFLHPGKSATVSVPGGACRRMPLPDNGSRARMSDRISRAKMSFRKNCSPEAGGVSVNM